jgi:hypothetical protein
MSTGGGSAGGSGGSGGVGTGGGLGTGGGPSEPAACFHFRSGNYFREADSVSRNIDGVKNLQSDFSPGAPDTSDFVGVVLQIDWANLESTKGTYDFSHIDQALAIAKAAGKSLRVKIMDRTFWLGCNKPNTPQFVPSYVNQVPPPGGGGTCYADIWNPATVDGLIALHIAVAKRYDADPAFAGLNSEETAIETSSAQITKDAYAQRVRLAQELFAAVPDALFISELNWPSPNNDIQIFNSMVDKTLVMSPNGVANGMGISWPDSWINPSSYTPMDLGGILNKIQCTESASESGKKPCVWYDLGRNYNHKVIVAPNIEGGTLLGTAAEGEAHYQMLDMDIGAHMITWETWSAPNAKYFRDVAVPTVHAHAGKLHNSACPFK